MRIVFLTDTHVTIGPVGQRDENYLNDVMGKIEVVLAEIRPDWILHGGDIFHSPVVPYAALNKLLGLIKKYRQTSWAAIPGQHDVRGRDFSNLYKYPYGALCNNDNFSLTARLDEDNVADCMGNKYALAACSFYDSNVDALRLELTRGIRRCREEVREDVIILLHSLVTDRELAYPTITVEQLGDCGRATVLCGDYHEGFDLITIGETTYINPGAFSRLTRTSPPPAVLLLDTDRGNIWEKVYMPYKDNPFIENNKEPVLVKDGMELLPQELGESRLMPIEAVYNTVKRLGYDAKVRDVAVRATEEVIKEGA